MKRGSCQSHETLVKKVLEHARAYDWVEEDIDYEFYRDNNRFCGQIDALGYRSPENITIYEAKSTYTPKTLLKGISQLDRAEMYIRQTGQICGRPVKKNATINKVYVSRQKIKRV